MTMYAHRSKTDYRDGASVAILDPLKHMLFQLDGSFGLNRFRCHSHEPLNRTAPHAHSTELFNLSL